MKPYLFIIVPILLASCHEGSQNKNIFIGITNKKFEKIVYTDSTKSSFISSDSTSNGYTYKKIETAYKILFITPHPNSNLKHYVAKYITTTEASTNNEGQQRNIKIEIRPLDNPDKIEFTIQKDCDEIILNDDTYKTLNFGCCGAEDQIQLYDYDNKLIIEGDAKILIGEIPTSRIKIFVAYKNETRDSAFFGTLFYCYNSSDKYSIRIKGSLPSEKCSPFTPNIYMATSSSEDKFNKESNEYSFWSLNNAKNKNQINRLSLKIAFDCDNDLHLDTISIPIINGLPFGKNVKNQEFVYRRK